jgi:uncharacterized protein YbjT (DUF2867 family)
MESGRILLCGGTGLLGCEIAVRLAARGATVRALVRPTSDASRLAALGFEVVRGDVRDSPTLAEAVAGVRTVVSTINTMARLLGGDTSVSIRDVDDLGYANLVAECERAGVERFVFASILDDPTHGATPFTAAKAATERRLRASAMHEVIVRADMFQEVWFTPVVGFDWAHGRATVYGRGEARHAYVALGDVAEAMVRLAVADDPPRTVDVAGPEALSRLEAINAFERASSQPIRVRHVPRPVLAAGSRLLRPVKPAIASVMGMALASDLADSPVRDEDLRALGIVARPVSEYIEVLAKGGRDAVGEAAGSA